MEDAEKLLQAARMIQEHCKNTESGGVCPFSHTGFCEGVEYCGIAGVGETIPREDWEIPKRCRWTSADIALAKALDMIGADSVHKYSDGEVGAGVPDHAAIRCIPNAFISLKAGETIQLSDIIAEGEKQ